MDPTYNGDVTISVANDPGFTTTVQAKERSGHVRGLTLSATADSETIQAVAGGLSAAVTGPLNMTPVGPTPTIISEQVVTTQKRNKRGKPVGKPVFVGFALEFSTAMNPAAPPASPPIIR